MLKPDVSHTSSRRKKNLHHVHIALFCLFHASIQHPALILLLVHKHKKQSLFTGAVDDLWLSFSLWTFLTARASATCRRGRRGRKRPTFPPFCSNQHSQPKKKKHLYADRLDVLTQTSATHSHAHNKTNLNPPFFLLTPIERTSLGYQLLEPRFAKSRSPEPRPLGHYHQQPTPCRQKETLFFLNCKRRLLQCFRPFDLQQVTSLQLQPSLSRGRRVALPLFPLLAFYWVVLFFFLWFC